MWVSPEIASDIWKPSISPCEITYNNKKWLKVASGLFFGNSECPSGWNFPYRLGGCHSLVRLAGFRSVIFQHGSRDDKVMHSRSPEIGLDALPTRILSWVQCEEPLNPIGRLLAFKWAEEWFYFGDENSTVFFFMLFANHWFSSYRHLCNVRETKSTTFL